MTKMGLLSSLGQFWTEWDLQVIVLLSLTLQILLIILGNRRKYNNNVLLRTVLWFSYLIADSVAIYALGLLSNKLANIRKNYVSWNANMKLNAFWAPFLLLHLGGPDTITAYALEDNELWSRHLLGLVSQAAAAAYVIFTAWTTPPRLSVLSFLIFLAGVIKYGERTWVLRSASKENRRMPFTTVQPSSSDNEFQYSSPDENEFVMAYKLLQRSKYFFSDNIFTEEVRKAIKVDHTKLSLEKAFRIIEIELGWVYDLLYTKAPILYTCSGLCLRLLSIFLTCIVLVLFCYHQKHKYSKADVYITYTLLVGGVVLETYSALALLFSDRFVVWLSKHTKTSTLQTTLTSFPMYKTPRWSNTISQLSLLTFITNPLPFSSILKLINVDEKSFHIKNQDIPIRLKEKVFEELTFKAEPGLNLSRVHPSYENFENFVTSAVCMHFKIEILYCLQKHHIVNHNYDDILKDCELAVQISRYMFYLVVVHPSMFVSEGKLSLDVHFIRDEVTNILSSRYDRIEENEEFDEALDVLLGKPRLVETKQIQVCTELIHKIVWRRSEYVPKQTNAYELLRYACMFASQDLIYLTSTGSIERKILKERWERNIMDMLQDILLKGAVTSNGMEHAQQLRFGGEFFTHVWFLALHLGIFPRYAYSRDTWS